MNHSGYRLALWLPALCLLLVVATAPALAKPQAASSGTPSSETTAKKSKQKSKKDGAAAEDKSAAPDQSTANASPGAAAHPAAPRKASNPAPGGAASDADIAAAKASGKVWVNLSSGVYHKSGRWYGRTKNGKFMTEAEAKAAGYKGSQRD
ncbi:MAG: hypothetical protein ACHP7J_05965 [Terriglobales bacterium]